MFPWLRLQLTIPVYPKLWCHLIIEITTPNSIPVNSIARPSKAMFSVQHEFLNFGFPIVISAALSLTVLKRMRHTRKCLVFEVHFVFFSTTYVKNFLRVNINELRASQLTQVLTRDVT
jgi:hypothetical protein